MVEFRTTGVESKSLPRFIYITGCDGTGKTTQAKLLVGHLQQLGVRCQHLWLRFPFFTSLPLLAYARWRGYSWSEEVEGERYGYWDFQDSKLLRMLFPWTLLVDAALASLIRVYLPLRLGKTIVCERFVLDMLVDMAVAFDEPQLVLKIPGRLFLRLLPSESRIIILDLDVQALRERRWHLMFDRALGSRLDKFRHLVKEQSLPVISSNKSVPEIFQQLLQSLEG